MSYRRVERGIFLNAACRKREDTCAILGEKFVEVTERLMAQCEIAVANTRFGGATCPPLAIMVAVWDGRSPKPPQVILRTWRPDNVDWIFVSAASLKSDV